MRRITILILFVVMGVFAQTQNSLTNNIVDNYEQDYSSSKIIDYKKTSDSLLEITEKLNYESKLKLDELKQNESIRLKQQQEIKAIKTNINNNIRIVLAKMIEKNKQLNAIKNNIANNTTTTNNRVENENEYKLDSIYVKKNIFRKSKWIYIITFPDGKTKTIK